MDMAVAVLKGETPQTTGSYNNKAIDVKAKQTEVIIVDQANVRATLIDSGYYPESDFSNLK
jgi:putative multiple sugar transport system substrate-binding protein